MRGTFTGVLGLNVRVYAGDLGGNRDCIGFGVSKN